MANRFRMAVKNAGEEILKVGKNNDNYLEVDSVENFEAKEIETELKDFFPKEEVFVEKTYVESKNQMNEFAQIGEFLKETVSNDIYELRLSKLREIINALIFQGETQKPLLLIDKANNIEKWIHAIKLAVPEKLRHILTFNKIKGANEYSQCIIFNNLIISDLAKVLENYSDNYQVFDFSRISYETFNTNSKYAELVQVGYLNNNGKFQEFMSFFDKFEYSNLDINLERCLMLFYYMFSGSELLDKTSIVKALEFADTYGNATVYKSVFHKMKLSTLLDEEMAFITIRFMLKASKIISEKEYFSKTYSFIFDYLNHLLETTDVNDLEQVNRLYTKIYEVEENNVEKFINFGLDVQNINKLTDIINKNDNNFAIFYLTMILKALNEKGNKWSGNSAYLAFIDKAFDGLVDNFEAVKSVIDSVSNNLEYKANLILLYYKKVSNDELRKEQIVKYFAEEQSTNKDINSFMIKSQEGANLVFNEFKHNLTIDVDKAGFFWKYKNKVFDNNEVFKKEYFSEAVDFYLRSIKDEQIYNDEWTKLLNMVSNNQLDISNKVLAYFINDYENMVPLVNPDIITQLNLKDIARIKKAKTIETTSVNFFMMEFGKEIKRVRDSQQMELLLKNQMPDIYNITESKLEEFFHWSLDLFFSNNFLETDEIVDFYNKVIEKRGDKGTEFIEGIFGANKFNSLVKAIDTFSAKKVQFYLSVTLKHFVNVHKIWDVAGDKEGFITKAVIVLGRNKEMLEHLLQQLVESIDYFVEILCICAYDKNALEVAMDFFNRNSRIKGEDWLRNIKLQLGKCEGGSTFLYEEYVSSLEQATNKRAFFWNYIKEVEENYPELKTKKFSDIFEGYIKSFGEKDINKDESYEILNYIMVNNVDLTKDTLIKLVINFEYSLDIGLPNKEIEDLVYKIGIYKKARNIVTYPDVINIVRFGFSIVNSPTAEVMIQLLKASSINLAGLTKDKYLSFIQRLLSVIGEKLNMVENTENVKASLFVESFKAEYNNIYNEIIFQQISDGRVNLSKNHFKALIKNHEDSFDVIANLVLLYFNKGLEDNNVQIPVQLFVEMVNESTIFKMKPVDIRKYFLKHENGTSLLFEEYKLRLTNTNNKAVFFSSYWNEMANSFETYKKNFYSKAIDAYFVSISNSENFAEACYGILKQIKNEDVSLKKETLVAILTATETLVSISSNNPKQKDIIKDAIEFKTNKKVNISPDIVSLINFGENLDKATDLDNMRHIIANSNLELGGIDFSRYEEWLEWCLPKLIRSANTWQMHASIKKSVCLDSLKGIFFTIYIGMLSDLLVSDSSKNVYSGSTKEEGSSSLNSASSKNNKNIGFNDIFAQFVIFFINGKDQLGGDTYIQGRANIINALSRCTDSKISEIDKLITLTSYDLRGRDIIVKEWNQIKSRMSPGSRKDKGLFGIFKK